MTRDEMIGAISHAIVVGESNYIPSKVTAETILNTIFAALNEPTEGMNDKARYLMSWLDGYGRPTYKNLRTHCRLLGKTPPPDCPDIDHVPPKAQRTAWIFQAMLHASPLAPEGDGT